MRGAGGLEAEDSQMGVALVDPDLAKRMAISIDSVNNAQKTGPSLAFVTYSFEGAYGFSMPIELVVAKWCLRMVQNICMREVQNGP